MNVQRLFSIIRKETAQLLRDRRTLGTIITLPIIQMVLYGYLSNEVLHQPTAVWDQSQTAESRALVAAFENTRYFSVRYWAGNLEEIERRLDAGQVKVGLAIPPDYAQRLRGDCPGARAGHARAAGGDADPAVRVDAGEDPPPHRAGVHQPDIYPAAGVGLVRRDGKGQHPAPLPDDAGVLLLLAGDRDAALDRRAHLPAGRAACAARPAAQYSHLRLPVPAGVAAQGAVLAGLRRAADVLRDDHPGCAGQRRGVPLSVSADHSARLSRGGRVYAGDRALSEED